MPLWAKCNEMAFRKEAWSSRRSLNELGRRSGEGLLRPLDGDVGGDVALVEGTDDDDDTRLAGRETDRDDRVRLVRGVDTVSPENFRVLEGVSSTDLSGTGVSSSWPPRAISLSFRFFDGDAVKRQGVVADAVSVFLASSFPSTRRPDATPGLDALVYR